MNRPKRKSGLDKKEREIDNLIDDQNFRTGIKTAANAFKNTVVRDTPDLQRELQKLLLKVQRSLLEVLRQAPKLHGI